MRGSRLGTLVVALALVVQPLAAGEVVLQLAPRTEPENAGAPKAAVVTFSRGGEESRRKVVVPGKLNVPDTGPFPLKLTLAGDGVWAPPLTVDGPGKRVVWKVWRTVPVHLGFRLGPGAKSFPERVKVAFQGCPDRRGRRSGPTGAVEAPVSRASATVELPRACLDLEVLTQRFAPVSVANVSLGGGTPTSLNGLWLRPGSSISGTVVSALDGLGVENVSVRLRAFGRGAPGRVLRSTRTDVRGHFRFAGLAPGDYLVEVLRKGSVMARTRAETTRGAETTLQTVEVGPPASLDVAVEPPDCLGHSWRVCVFPAEETTSLACADTRASGEGRLSGLPAGEYRVTLTATCSSKSETVDSQRLTLGWGDRASISFTPSLCLVSGTLTAGDEPVTADLTFEPSTLGRSVIQASTDGQGKFRVLLPHTGQYNVEVRGDGIFRQEHRNLRKCPATLRIELPDTALRGRVVTETEEPAPGALVTALGELGAGPEVARATAAEDGSFVFRGLDPGPWRVRAERGDASSAWVERAVSTADMSSGETVLVLHRERKVRLHVVDSAGVPVPRARVALSWVCNSPTGQPLDGGRMESTSTSGVVELSLPETCQELQVVAGADSGTLTMGRMAVAPELTVHLPDRGGKLRFSGAPRYWDSTQPPFLALAHGGAVVVLQQLAMWPGTSHSPGDLDQQLLTPSLEPGTYSLVLLPSAGSIRAAMANPGSLGALAQLEITASETVEVNLDTIPELNPN